MGQVEQLPKQSWCVVPYPVVGGTAMKQGDLVTWTGTDPEDHGSIGVLMDWYHGFRDWVYPPYGEETVIVLWNNGNLDYTRYRRLELLK